MKHMWHETRDVKYVWHESLKAAEGVVVGQENTEKGEEDQQSTPMLKNAIVEAKSLCVNIHKKVNIGSAQVPRKTS